MSILLSHSLGDNPHNTVTELLKYYRKFPYLCQYYLSKIIIRYTIDIILQVYATSKYLYL